MKALYCKLCSLLPPQSSKEVGSMSDNLEEAGRKSGANEAEQKQKESKSANLGPTFSNGGGLKLELCVTGSTLDVVLVAGIFHPQHMFKETIRILIEEGARMLPAQVFLWWNKMCFTLFIPSWTNSTRRRRAGQTRRDEGEGVKCMLEIIILIAD